MAEPGTARDEVGRAYADGGGYRRRLALYDYRDPPLEFRSFALGLLPAGAAPVLDVGCGPGLYLARCPAEPHPPVGVDLSVGMLREARRRAPGAHLVAGSADQLPVAAHRAGAVLAMHVLYHLADVDAALRELRRVLRPGGTLLLGLNGRANLERLQATISAAAGTALDLPARRVTLDDADRIGRHVGSVEVARRCGTLAAPIGPVVDFVASLRDLLAPHLPEGTTWDGLLAGVRAAVEDEVGRAGAWHDVVETGVLICRV